jgi:hypothetical protein
MDVYAACCMCVHVSHLLVHMMYACTCMHVEGDAHDGDNIHGRLDGMHGGGLSVCMQHECERWIDGWVLWLRNLYNYLQSDFHRVP